MAHRSTRKGKRSRRSRTTRRQRGGEEVPQYVLKMIEDHRRSIQDKIKLLQNEINLLQENREAIASRSTRYAGLYERLSHNLERMIEDRIHTIQESLDYIRQLRNIHHLPIPQDEQEWAEKYDGATIETFLPPMPQPAPPREVPTLVIPKNTENIITALPIENGNILTNFRSNGTKFESNYGYYYKKGTVEKYLKHEHPRTRGRILNKKNYKAKIANNENSASLNRVQTNLFSGGANNNNAPLANIQTNLFEGNNDPAERNYFNEGLRQLRRITYNIQRIGRGNNNSSINTGSSNNRNNVESINLYRNNNGANAAMRVNRRNNNNFEVEAEAEDPVAPVANVNQNSNNNVGSVGGRRRRSRRNRSRRANRK